ncbi:hypothetical protein LWI29_021566 [Acer saccharum]|uniref:Rx N-terminal domain-containing protein n=1 Tax=Acer saccharum TaxID=4024 RepID=A0AA39SME8_ACESA|nr:hypothetical protein LWI29_021566 [Acer saccharum]
MEVVAAILGSAVTEAGRSLCGSFSSIKNFISFQSNLSALEKEKKSLVDLKNKVIEDVDYSSDAQMTLWLREVEQILLEVNSVPTGIAANNGKLCVCFFNCSERYRLIKETARMLKEIERLLKVGDIAVKIVGRNYLAKAVEHIPGPSISGISLTQISEVEMSESLKRVSFMNNRITKLPDCRICCPETVSLLLQGNRFLSRIPNGFLQAFESLKVLNLSETRIRSLPQSILQLGDIRILLLKKCFYLEELPQLGGLSQLQVLDCSETGIRELPSGMKKLINLRQLCLSGTYNLKTIQSGIVSGLSGLEVLDMTSSAYVWGLKEEANDRQANFEELQNLERLHSLSVRLGRIQSLQNEDLTLIGRLRIFKLLIGPEAISFQSKHDKRKLIISGLQFSGEWIDRLLTNASMMHLNNYSGLNQLLETMAIRSIGSYTGLKSLTITRSSSSLRPDGGCTALDLLPNLEELRLYELTKLGSISELVGLLGLRFSRLKLIEVFRCYGLEYLLTCEPVVPNLRTLKLVKLPKLKTLSRQDGSGLHSKSISCVYHMKAIEQVEVIKCDNLRKLPLTIENAITMKEIRGQVKWWDQLELEGDNTKSSLERFFNGE